MNNYWYCPNCHGNFDPGEKCDCETIANQADVIPLVEHLSYLDRLQSSIGRRLHHERSKRNLTLVKLEELSAVHSRTIRRIERGNYGCTASIPTLLQLSSAMGMSLSNFLDGIC